MMSVFSQKSNEAGQQQWLCQSQKKMMEQGLGLIPGIAAMPQL